MNFDAPDVRGRSDPGHHSPHRPLGRGGDQIRSGPRQHFGLPARRQSLLTGRYAVRHGGEGFNPIREDVPTLVEELKKSGYLNGILGKEKHYKPDAKFAWDFIAGEKDLASGLGIGRSPERYRGSALEFFRLARKAGKPFFLSANAHDPHRPFAGSTDERNDWGQELPRCRENHHA